MMTVCINEAWSNGLTFCIRFFFGRSIRQVTDKGNRIISDADIGLDPRSTTAVINDAVTDDAVIGFRFTLTGTE